MTKGKTIKFSKDRIDLNARHLDMAARLVNHAYEDLKNDVDMTPSNLESLKTIRKALEEINRSVKRIGRTRK